MYENHKIPVEVNPGFSTYIRFRIYFEEMLDQTDLVYYNNVVARWYIATLEGTRDGIKRELLSFDRFIYPSLKMYETRFDVAKCDASVIEPLISTIEKDFVPGAPNAKIIKIEVGYSDRGLQ